MWLTQRESINSREIVTMSITVGRRDHKSLSERVTSLLKSLERESKILELYITRWEPALEKPRSRLFSNYHDGLTNESPVAVNS